MQLSEFTQKLLAQLTQEMSYQQLINQAYQAFHLPIIMTDASFHLMATSEATAIQDPAWQRIINQGSPADQFIVEDYFKTNISQSVLKQKKSQVIDWGPCQAYPQTCGGIWLSDELLGFISVLFIKPELANLAQKLNDCLCQASILIAKLNDSRRISQGLPVRRLLARKLFMIDQDEALDLTVYQSFFKITPNFVFLTVTSTESVNLDQLLRGLKHAHQHYLFWHAETVLWLFFDRIDIGKLHWLKAFLKQYPVHCGCSATFTDLSQRARFLQQAQLAKDVALSENFVTYEQHYLAIVLNQARQQIAAKNLILPTWQNLANYDRQHQTDLVITLATYLKCQQRISVAAKQLHLHRNTLVYRLTRLRELVKVDLDNEQMALTLRVGYELWQSSNG